jgi:hypothetical protein
MAKPAYLDPANPEHNEIVAKVNALGQKLYPEPIDGKEPPPYADIPTPYFPEEVSGHWDADAEAVFRREAREAGLSKAQVSHFMKVLEKGTIADYQARGAVKERCLQVLRGEWKESFDQKLNLAKEALGQFPDLDEALHVSGFGNHPDIVRAFHALGQAMREKGQLLVDPDQIQDVEAAKKELKRAMGSEPYFNSNHPQHRRVVENVNKLARRAWGEGKIESDD